MPSIKEVARLLSITTVSRVINNKVSKKETAEKVWEVVHLLTHSLVS